MADMSRRSALKAGAAGAALLWGGRLFTAAPATAATPATSSLVTPDAASLLRYTAPATESAILQQGLAVGNGRIGALTTCGPASEALYLNDGSFWNGTANATLQSDGQFPYDNTEFGHTGLMGKVYVAVPAHQSATGYTRQLDMANGIVSASYTVDGVTYRREIVASAPGEVIAVRLTQSGGGTYTGTITLAGLNAEQPTAESATNTAGFAAASDNGLKYAVAASATASGGTVGVSGGTVTFTGCSDVLVVVTAGTDYSPTAAGYQDTSINPAAVAASRLAAAKSAGADQVLAAHLADYQPLYGAQKIDLGASTPAQRGMATPDRLAARSASGAAPDPELEASYVQFGRYLMISGSRHDLPINLQGLWFDGPNPPWQGDYHTDINVQMNYWLPDRCALPASFEPFADYCVSQLPVWTATTTADFNDTRNRYRNTSGKIAGWAVGISTNINGGSGWNWHPAGNAWLCTTLFDHYQYTQDAAYLAKIYPLLKGACEFWQARLVTMDVGGSQVLVDDYDWSPEHGPDGTVRGITYAQELVWQLFEDFGAAAAVLHRDASFAGAVADLQSRLYLPVVSPTTGDLEEWMDPADLADDPQHRHLSPLIGLFPGDRIAVDSSPAALLAGARSLLTRRGDGYYGWAEAWRSVCWARLKDAGKAYQYFASVMKLSVNNSNGTAINFFDVYTGLFQIDANLGTPAAAVEMLVYSRPGVVEVLPALPPAWGTGSITGVRARGGLTVDLTWSGGQATSVTLHGPAGATTSLRFGTWTQHVTIPASGALTVTPARPATVRLVNRLTGMDLEVPGGSRQQGVLLDQWPDAAGSSNQQWRIVDRGAGKVALRNVNSGLLANVGGGSTADGATLIQWPSGNSTNEEWTIDPVGGGFVTLTSVRSGKVIGVADAATSQGATLTQQTNTGGYHQNWTLIAV
ncbi:glycoside hydrolase N-terminal domain-containing protein [Streptomyces sp. NPDC088194]|uniref:glycosyl hydrolase family 95 catalytic domain-containing protein n=1 Tax=Streptomyces sp. NPDC088194 TaxID=3154931 RepID=UPI00344F7461